MLYTLSYQGSDGNYDLPVCVQTTDANNKIIYYTAKELLTNKELIPALRHKGITLGVKYLADLKKPMVVAIGNNKTQSVARFLEVSKKSNYRLFTKEEVNKIFGGRLEGEKLDNAYEIFVSIHGFVQLQTQPIKFKLDVPNTVAVDANTIKAIQDINNEQTELEFVKKGLNENKFMKTPQDEVFIKLLNYSELRAEVVTKPFPSPSTIYLPYRTNDFRMPFYQNKLLPTDDRKLIEGNADNNDLIIQENEKAFYDAMCELMDYGIQQEYPDVTLEQTRKDGISSKVVKDYLIDLAIEVCKWNWLHTGFLEFDVDFDDDNDDDDSSYEDETDATLGNASFLESEANKRGESGSFILRTYLERASKENIYAPCEAVIKLLRWGERKPTRLKVEGIDRYLVLKSFTTSQLSGSLVNLEVVKEGTKQYRPKQLVMAYGSFQDMKYLRGQGFDDDTLNVPVGLLCIQQYVSGQTREVYFSMIDLVNDIESGRNEIFDLERDANGNIQLNMEFGPDDKVGLGDVIVKVNNDIDSRVVYNTANEIKDLYLKYKSNVNKASYLAVWNRFLVMPNVVGELELASFEDEQDFRYKVETTGFKIKAYLEANIAKATLPVILEVANKCEDMRNSTGEPSVSDVINLYNLALLKRDIVDVMNPQEDKGSANEKINALSSKMLKMNSFEKSEAKQEPKQEKVEEPVHIEKEVLIETGAGIEQVEPLDLYKPLLLQPTGSEQFCNIKHNGEAVGRLAIVKINGKSKYILMTPEECKYPTGKASLELIKLIKGMINDYYFVLKQTPEKCTFRFYSRDTLTFYRKLLKDLI